MTDTTPPTKLASELKIGDWIHADTLVTIAHGRVTSIQHWGRNDTLLDVDVQGESQVVAFTVDQPVCLATEADLEEQRANRRRADIARQLHDLADAIIERSLPLPDQYVALHLDYPVETAAEVEQIADVLSAELRRSPEATRARLRKTPYTLDVTIFAHDQTSTTTDSGPVPAGDAGYGREVDNGDGGLRVPPWVAGSPVGGPPARATVPAPGCSPICATVHYGVASTVDHLPGCPAGDALAGTGGE